jgi:hypothetical protein
MIFGKDRRYTCILGDFSRPQFVHLLAAREKSIRVIEKLCGFRLTKAAELAEAGIEESFCMPSATRGSRPNSGSSRVS